MSELQAPCREPGAISYPLPRPWLVNNDPKSFGVASGGRVRASDRAAQSGSRPTLMRGFENKLVAEVTYLTWPADDLLRHTVYIGLREDKPANEALRESGRL
jgi:hypothetical protein